MKIKILCSYFVTFGFLILTSFGATVHLNSGDSLSGRIQSMDDQTLSLESNRGFGILQIDRADIRLIEFEGAQRNLSRKFGFGFYQRGVALNGQGRAREYNIGSVSLKYWLNQADSLDILLGYSGTVDGGDKLLEIFNLETRFSRVFLQEGNENLYWGGSVGYMTVADETEKLDDSGITLRGFLGIEVFLVTFPNLGFSSEIGFGNQTVGDRTSLSIFNVGFPTLSVHYYF